MGSKTQVVNQESTQTRELSADEKEFNTQQLEILDRQVQLLESNQEFQQQSYELVRPLLEQQAQLLQQDINDLNDPVVQEINSRARELQLEQIKLSQENLPLEQELLQAEVDRIRRGGAATDEQKELIGGIADRTIEQGTIEIDRFLDQSLDKIKTELAPGRGLRPGDSPILDVADEAAAEAVRQRGSLESNVRGAQFDAELNFPLAAGSLASSQTQFQQQFGADRAAFASRLAESANNNRLQVQNLIGNNIGRSQSAGISLAGTAQPGGFIQSGTVHTTGTSRTRTSGSTWGEIISGVGGLFEGAGALYAASSRGYKDTLEPVDGKAAVEAIRTMDVDRWRYHGDTQDHIGPYAEDFQAAFGVGDGKGINLIDAVGVLFAAVKELSQKEAAHA